MVLLDVGHLPDQDLGMFSSAYEAQVKSFVQGVYSSVLYEAARKHALYMASVGVQGHQGWDQRFRAIIKAMPGRLAYEIAAESWPDETDIPAGSKSMVDSWRQSSGHWGIANGPTAEIGYAMARGRSKRTGEETWYGCGIATRVSRSSAVEIAALSPAEFAIEWPGGDQFQLAV